MAEFDYIQAEVESIDEAGVSIIDTSEGSKGGGILGLYRLVARLDTTGELWDSESDIPGPVRNGSTTDREAQYLISVLFHALNSPEGLAIRVKAEDEVNEYLGPNS